MQVKNLPKGEAMPHVHFLNGTLCATERTLCCIMENYQTPTGLRVPEALQPYLGTDFIPYSEKKIVEWKKRVEEEAKVPIKPDKPGKKPKAPKEKD